jgi:hypothetical protein
MDRGNAAEVSKQVPPIAVALDTLDHAVVRLSGALEKLQSRVESVMAPPVKVPEDGITKSTVVPRADSQVVNRIGAAEAMVRQAERAVHDMLERVQT